MNKSIFILGRQPDIGRAELESLLGAENLSNAGDQAMLCNQAANDLPFFRIGGSTRLADVIGSVPSGNLPQIAKYAAKMLPKIIAKFPAEGKIKLGISCFGLQVAAPQLLRLGLELKKVCRQAQRNARVVPNSQPALSSAQVLHNQLTGELGLELLLVYDGQTTWIAKTSHVQDINAYARRDQGRPKRDARVGMLPPKLAQIIVNLASGPTKNGTDRTLLDPFCGTGVVLQEALLDGLAVYGTDIEPRMVEFTEHNLEWLKVTNNLPNNAIQLQIGDATNHLWQPVPDLVACETYLGRPLSSWPEPLALGQIINTCNTIIQNTLGNLAGQLRPRTRLCLAIPAWIAPNGDIKHLPLLDLLGKIGYNLVRFEHVRSKALVYYRPGQIVGREMLVISKK